MNTQSLIFEIIGYNFRFFTPFDAISQFHERLWSEIKVNFGDKSDKKRNPKQDEYYHTRKDIIHRFMLQIYQVAIDSCILPLALYFEPEEIAAASIALASKIFKMSKPRFTNR